MFRVPLSFTAGVGNLGGPPSCCRITSPSMPLGVIVTASLAMPRGKCSSTRAGGPQVAYPCFTGTAKRNAILLRLLRDSRGKPQNRMKLASPKRISISFFERQTFIEPAQSSEGGRPYAARKIACESPLYAICEWGSKYD